MGTKKTKQLKISTQLVGGMEGIKEAVFAELAGGNNMNKETNQSGPPAFKLTYWLYGDLRDLNEFLRGIDLSKPDGRSQVVEFVNLVVRDMDKKLTDALVERLVQRAMRLRGEEILVDISHEELGSRDVK